MFQRSILSFVLLISGYWAASCVAEQLTSTCTITAVDAAHNTVKLVRKTSMGEKTGTAKVALNAKITVESNAVPLDSLNVPAEAEVVYETEQKALVAIRVRRSGPVTPSAARQSVIAENAKPFVGNWALTTPGGNARWIGVTDDDGVLKASILWGGGSVVPVSSVRIEDDKLILTRIMLSPKKTPKIRETETIRAKVSGDQMALTTERDRGDGKVFGQASFTGKRTPPLPPTPDLSKVRLGEPIKLFNGENLDGWMLVEPGAANGWSVKDGVLTNDPKQEQGKPHKAYGNLRTVSEFEDFNLKLETNVPKGGNSGIYLRGIYEIQIADTFGRALDSHNMGAIYSRIYPTESAEKPAGQWQSFDITLVDRHVTVILNGKKIIDNQPLLGCTGGALWSDPLRPGPIYLQGDHTGANYRNIVLTPLTK